MSAPAPATPLTLRPGEALQPWMLVAAALLAAFVFANAFLAIYKGRDPWDVAIHMAVGIAVAIAVLLTYRCRLQCDERGLRFASGAPWPVSLLVRDWDCAWSEIRAARWKEGVAPAILEIDTARGKRRVMALQWQLDPGEASRCRRAMVQFRIGRAKTFDATLLPLVRVMRARGIDVPPEIGSADSPGGFDLTQNPATMAALLVAAFTAGFWFLDANVSNQMYGRNEPWAAIGACAAVMAAAFAVAQSRAGVPLVVNVFVSALLAVTTGLACYGGLQRLNQFLDGEGPRSVDFTLSRDGTLVSNVAGVADLPPGFFGDPGFWARQKAGSTHRFGYHRALGFETLDIREYRERLKSIYGRDPGRDVNRP